MASCYWHCILLNLSTLLVLLATSATHAQPKALPEPVFAAALDSARKYADDRTLINFCLRTNDEIGPFLYLGMHDDLEQTRQRMQAAGASLAQVGELLRAVLSAVRLAARNARDTRLEQECEQREIAKGYALLAAETGAKPLFMRPPFVAMKP